MADRLSDLFNEFDGNTQSAVLEKPSQPLQPDRLSALFDKEFGVTQEAQQPISQAKPQLDTLVSDEEISQINAGTLPTMHERLGIDPPKGIDIAGDFKTIVQAAEIMTRPGTPEARVLEKEIPRRAELFAAKILSPVYGRIAHVFGLLDYKKFQQALDLEAEQLAGFGAATVPAAAEVTKLAVEWGVIYPMLFKGAGLVGETIKKIPQVRKGLQALEASGGIKALEKSSPRLLEAGKKLVGAATKGFTVGATTSGLESVGQGKTYDQWLVDMGKQGFFLAGVSGVFSLAQSRDVFNHVNKVRVGLNKAAVSRIGKRPLVNRGELANQELAKIDDVVSRYEAELLSGKVGIFGKELPNSKEVIKALGERGFYRGQKGATAKELRAIKGEKKFKTGQGRIAKGEELAKKAPGLEKLPPGPGEEARLVKVSKAAKRAAAIRPDTNQVTVVRSAEGDEIGVFSKGTNFSKIPKGAKVTTESLPDLKTPRATTPGSLEFAAEQVKEALTHEKKIDALIAEGERQIQEGQEPSPIEQLETQKQGKAPIKAEKPAVVEKQPITEAQKRGEKPEIERKPLEPKEVTAEKGQEGIKVFHGTDADFTNFEERFLGSANGTAPINKAGFSFTTDSDVAKTFGKNVIEAKIDIKNPFVIDAKKQDYSEFKDVLNEKLENIDKSKYDGIIIKNYKDTGVHGKTAIISDHHIPFNVKQIQIAQPPTAEGKKGVTDVKEKEAIFKKARVAKNKVVFKPVEQEGTVLEGAESKLAKVFGGKWSGRDKGYQFVKGKTQDFSDALELLRSGQIKNTDIPRLFGGKEDKGNVRRFKQKIKDILASPPIKKKPTTKAKPTVGKTKQPPVTPTQPFTATEKAKPVGLAKSVEAVAINKGLVKFFEEIPEFNTVNIKEQAALASKLINEDYEKAKRVALGTEVAPSGVIPEMVLAAVSNKAVRDGDVETLRDISVMSSLTREATIMGQRIRALGELGDQSPVKAIQGVVSAREKTFAKRKKRGLKSTRKAEVANVKESIRKARPKNGAKALSDFISSLQC